MPVRQPPDPLHDVRGGLAERLLGAELDRGAAHVPVVVLDDDLARAGAIGLAGDRARDLDLLHQRPDADRLASLDVRADAHRQLRVPPQSLLACHAATLPGTDPA